MGLGWVVPLLLGAGCAADTPPPPTPAPPAPSFATSTATAGTRDCATAVSLGARTARLPQSGPVALAPLDYEFGNPITHADPDPAGYRPFKIALLLRAGAEATVAIPAACRDRAKLTYLPGHDHGVRFVACPQNPDGDADFAGGFVLRAPVCLPLEITSDGRADRLVLEFGANVC